MSRKKRLRIIQFSLLVLSIIILFYTYLNQHKTQNKVIISDVEQKKLEEQLTNQTEEGDVFYNISYSGLDFSGNRYILNAKEARSDVDSAEKIYLKQVDATFYMKDDTILKVYSEKGLYNNKTLDTIFEENVKAFYEGSELFAKKAEFSNSKSFLIISDNVRVSDEKGTIVADKLLFDIEKQNLNIVSFNNNKINANVNLK